MGCDLETSIRDSKATLAGKATFSQAGAELSVGLRYVEIDVGCSAVPSHDETMLNHKRNRHDGAMLTCDIL